MEVIIDRFEGNLAVVETESGKMLNLPRELAEDAAEGDVLVITVDKKKTAERKNKIDSLMDKLFKD